VVCGAAVEMTEAPGAEELPPELLTDASQGTETEDAPEPVSEAFIAQKAAELEELKADIAALREHVALEQKRRAAEMHRGRGRRIEAIMAELLPVPDTLQEPVAAAPAMATPRPHAAAPRFGAAPHRLSPRPAAAPSGTSPRYVVPPVLTPRSSRPTTAPQTLPTGTRRASTPASRTPSVPKHAVPPKAKEPAPKLAPAAVALMASMHESKYTRPTRLQRSATAGKEAMKGAM